MQWRIRERLTRQHKPEASVHGVQRSRSSSASTGCAASEGTCGSAPSSGDSSRKTPLSTSQDYPTDTDWQQLLPLEHETRIPLCWRTPRSTTAHFFCTDSAEKFREHQRSGSTLRYSEHDILYSFNAQGYRTDEFEASSDKFRALALGCSLTQGVGLPKSETWSHLVCQQLATVRGHEVADLNLGSAGACNEGIIIRGMHVVRALKPRLVLVQYTFPLRKLHVRQGGDVREWARPQCDVSDEPPDYAAYFRDVQTQEDDLVQIALLINLFSGYLNSMNVPHVNVLCFQRRDTLRYLASRIPSDNSVLQYVRGGAPARDMLHPGREVHERVAQLATERAVAVLRDGPP